MNRTLWVLQVVLGIYFIAIGIMHFVVPDGLPGPMEWMYDLSDNLHVVAGIAEILGGIGLILPALTGIQPDLTVWAAIGLVAVMVGALIWHAGRGEPLNIAMNVVLAALLAFVAWGRWSRSPLPGSSRAAAV